MALSVRSWHSIRLSAYGRGLIKRPSISIKCLECSIKCFLFLGTPGLPMIERHTKLGKSKQVGWLPKIQKCRLLASNGAGQAVRQVYASGHPGGVVGNFQWTWLLLNNMNPMMTRCIWNAYAFFSMFAHSLRMTHASCTVQSSGRWAQVPLGRGPRPPPSQNNWKSGHAASMAQCTS